MDHGTSTALLLATHFATYLFPLTVRLIPVITQIGHLIVRFRKSKPTPQACHQFETQLGRCNRDGRVQQGRDSFLVPARTVQQGRNSFRSPPRGRSPQ